MKVVNSILELIGKTPMLKLNKLTKDIEAEVLVKLEYLNPTGSLKDRIALKMIEYAERDESLKPGYTIVESSTGNTGISLSFVGNMKGYKVVIYETIPGKMDKERVKIMESYGAEVHLTTLKMISELRDKSVMGAEVEIPGREICLKLEKRDPNVWWARQFSNPNNVAAHNETGREILAQTDGKVDAFVAAIGTGGTLMGVAEFLKEKLPDIRIVGVRPKGSKRPIIPGKPYPKTEISGGIISDMLERNLVDEIVEVSDEDAINMTHRLWREEGVFAGISSGANVLVAVKEAEMLGEGKRIVTVLPDSGDRYLTEEHFVT
ncbi:MAG: cysteine synthase family protein [Desulfobacterales bacterium]|nr:cysteine synthase family protein [Desulfobacterales bacterium]